jgi:hypothetical protein
MGPEMLTDAVAIEQRWNYFMGIAAEMNRGERE